MIHGCASSGIYHDNNSGNENSKEKSIINNAFITQNTKWQGTVEINGTVTVMKGITLTVLPGTVIKFFPLTPKTDDPHELTNGIVIEGKLLAHGTIGEKIIFTSIAQTAAPGDWGKILFKYSKDNILKYCKFEYAEYAIHAHFSTGEISNCEFSNNIEGLRLGMSKFIIKNNNIFNNISRGINFRQCANIIEYNNIFQNGTGIFLYEKNSKAKIINNNIYNNKNFNLQLGEFYQDDINIDKNWWGTIDISIINKFIYDKEDNSGLGTVKIY
ncbi:right-handed parallel beta-helix repeat-containing protein [Candidatus Desantisbacteria bacterium]|nr:right-handed parallel beta-helix repeat-containing protein [Candidatus Desantisbacteria bacterium]